MDTQSALQLMQETFDSLQRSGILEDSIIVKPDTVILGSGSSLDSLGFVTFLSDFEERVSDKASQEQYLVLTDIHDFNAEQSFLSAGTLAQYVAKITE